MHKFFHLVSEFAIVVKFKYEAVIVLSILHLCRIGRKSHFHIFLLGVIKDRYLGGVCSVSVSSYCGMFLKGTLLSVLWRR